MRIRKHKGTRAYERWLSQTNPLLGEHVSDARIIRTLAPRNTLNRAAIEEARYRSARRREFWIIGLVN